jgi:hypothetical protein
LTEILQKGDVDRRQKVASVIGNLGKGALPAVSALKAALKDPDPMVRAYAASALGGIGAPMSPNDPKNKGKPLDPDRPQITVVVPDLIAVLGNEKDIQVRVAAAVALKEIGSCAELESPTSTDVLIGTVANPSNDPVLRARTLWPLSLHKNIANLPKLFDALNQIVEIGPGDNQTKDLRYHAAFLLSKYKKKDVSNKVLDTLLEFLKDTSVNIAKNVKGGASGGTIEKTSGSSGTEIQKGGDARIMALQAINFIVNESYGGDMSKVKVQRPDILNQLKSLATDPKIDPTVQKYAANIVDYLS